jgi:hypothetical protein
MLLGRGLKMKKWKKNKSYVYYVPEYDEVYVATYKPEGEPWTCVKEFRSGFVDGGLSEGNFNPDVLILYTKQLEFIIPVCEYVGEL